MTQTPNPDEVAAQAEAWRDALAELATSRRDKGILRRVEAAIAAGLAVADSYAGTSSDR